MASTVDLARLGRKSYVSQNGLARFGRDFGGSSRSRPSIKYLCPAASLWQTLHGCDRFREHFARALERHPCTMATKKWPLSCEVSPGNQLKWNNRRRLQTFYWALKQMFPRAMLSEDCWLLLTTIRTATVNELVDGLTQVTKECMLRFSSLLRTVLGRLIFVFLQ